jgi:hypothetical protein
VTLAMPRAGRLWVVAGIGSLLLGGAILVAVTGFGGVTSSPAAEVQPPSISAPAGASGTPAAPSPSMGPQLAAAMPLTGDCLGCHETSDGIGTKPIPALAHPLDGWRDCTACHAADRLVKTAPGHSGIHADECLNCHVATTAAAPARPHPDHSNAACLECHGTKAPLPVSMTAKPEAACWVCHRSTRAEAPDRPHPLPAGQTCRSCHTAGEVGALPVDHVARSDASCTVCHAVSPAGAPMAPHDLPSRSDVCVFCHGQAAPSAGTPELSASGG